MSFNLYRKDQKRFHHLTQTALGAQQSGQNLSYVADIDVVTDEKLSSSIEYNKALLQCDGDPLKQITQQLYEQVAKENPVQFIKITYDQNMTVFYDGDGYLFSYPFIINCTHRHYNPELSEEENKELYYKCYYPHGHEYQLFITVQAQDHFDFQTLIEWGQKVVVSPYDKTFLNQKMGNTSGELILEFFAQQLNRHPHKDLKLVNLTLKETFKNSFVKVFDSNLIDLV